MSYECPNCGQVEPAVPTWEDQADYFDGKEPDRIGCKDCGIMEAV